MGLVEIKHGEWPRVAQPSFDRMVDQMSQTMRHLLIHSSTTLNHVKEACAAFEMETARIACKKRTLKDIADLRDILAQQERGRLDTAAFLTGTGVSATGSR
ncbi:MAG: hypothetical protein ACOH2H_07050 [Cypionkella sp.]